MQARNRRNPAVLQANDGELSPKMKMLIFFLYFMMTLAAVRGWMMIIETHNIYYETAAAFGTMIALSILFWTYSRVINRARQRLEAARLRESISNSIDAAEIAAAQQRLQLRRLYGDNVDFFLQGSAGLSTQMIDTLLRHFTYEIDRVREITCVKVVASVDVESGGAGVAGGVTCSSQGGEPGDYVSGFDECAVCLNDFVEGDALTELPCGHAYHRSCITAWLLNRNLCPMCKQVVVQIEDLTAGLPQAMVDAIPPAGTDGSAHGGGAAGVSSTPATGSVEATGATPERAGRAPIPRRRSHSGLAVPVGSLFGPLAQSSDGTPLDGTPARTPAESGEDSADQSGADRFDPTARVRSTDPPSLQDRRAGLAGARALSINDISDLQSLENV